MARRSPVKVGLALALLFVTSYGQADDTCRTGCRGASHTFKYHEGTTYKYNFDSKIQVSLSSAEGQQSVTEVKAIVLLTQRPQCNQIIKLQNVQIISNDGKKHNNIPDVDKPISINYHDGHLEDSICITPGDTQNSLNLKRAIASILQANLKSGHETDVFGLCPTEVSQHKEGNVLVVTKSRNLNRCGYRENIKQDFLATAFNLNSEIKSSPILNGDYDAKLRIKNGILDQATIQEKYLYVPFSVGDNGAKASIETTLKYIGTAKDNSQVNDGKPRSIIFEDPHPVNSPQTDVNSILAAVKQVAKTIDIVVGENTAKEFTNLVRILRSSKKDDLLAVYNQVRAGVGFSDKIGAKKIFLDALLRAGNGDNIEVAITLLKTKELSVIEQNLVYLGLSTVRHPTEGSLNAAIELLSNPALPRSAYLGIGNLAGRYCRQHSCENVDSVNKLTQKLIQKLGNGKATNRQQENDIIFVLKALRNIQHLNDNILAKITAIAQDKKAPNRLRVTALETYLGDPCKDKLRESALNLLKDIQQDSEIRIRAYLAAAQCPTSRVANVVKSVLESEPSYQVGGFIVSHIRNLRASANPDKELAKQHLGGIRGLKNYPIDPRKYSSNLELSYSIDSLGAANSIESNLIYSQNSFLPRSTTFNLTTEIFGHSFNFLEIETRQENLDRLVEHYFGPRGLLRSQSLQELWNTKGKSAENLIKHLNERLQKTLRARRDVSKAEIDHINKQVQIKTNELNSDLDLDLSVKAFGAEVVFLNVNDDVKKYTPEGIIDQIIDQLNSGLDKLKNFEETLRSNLLFLDAEFAYPTSSGFPLRLGVEGSSNTQIKASGGIDVRSLLQNGGTFKISVVPSANIEVSGRLTVDALVVESGLKVTSTLYTATGGDLTATLKENDIDVKFGLPVKEQKLISATHDIVFVNREWGAPEANVPLKFAQNKDFSICLDQLSPFLGLTFCGEFTGPNLQGQKVPILPFPLSGDAKVAITIERDDLSAFHFREVVVWDKLGSELVLESLGENGQKKASIALEAYQVPDPYFKVSLTSAVTSASLEGRITLNQNEKSASLRFLQDNSEYFAKLGVEIQGSPNKSIYKPIMQYKTPQNSVLQIPPYRVEGQIIAEKGGPPKTFEKYIFDNVKIVIPDHKIITINGEVGSEGDSFHADVTASDGTSSASFKGKLRLEDDLVQYHAEVKNSVAPDFNVRIKGEVSKSQYELRSKFQVAHGGDFSVKQNILNLENSLIVKRAPGSDFLIKTENKLTYPAQGTDLQFEFELKPGVIKYDVDIEYSNVKLGSELDWIHRQKNEGVDYKLKFEIWGLNNKLALKSKREVTGEQSQIENLLEVNGKRVEVNGKIKHHIRPQDIDAGADLIVKLPTHNTPFNIVSNLRVNANDFDASHKVTSGNTVYVDIFLKANRAGNANGSIKVNLKGQLTITGQVKANRGSGNGEIVFELPQVGRTSKIDSTFTIREPNFNIVVNIYPIFNQDKTKKITLSTHTAVTEHSIDSRNSIDVFGEKLEAVVKGAQEGEFNNGRINGEVEVILPNHQYLAAKLNREVRNVNKALSGNAIASIEYRPVKNQPGNKITAKADFKDVNPEQSIFDINYQLSAERSNGRSLNADLGLKRLPQGDSFIVQVSNKIYGSELGNPIETIFKSTYKDYVGNYEATSTYAPLGNLKVSGKYDLAAVGSPLSGDINIDGTFTSKSLRSLKLSASGSANQLKANLVDVKGKFDVFVDAPNEVIIQLQSEGEVRATDKDTRVKGSVKSGKLDPISIDAGVSIDESNKGDQKVQGDLTLNYGKNQRVKGDLTLIKLPGHEYKLDLKLDTPAENHKSNRLQVHTKRNEDNTHIQSEVIATSDGKTWTTNTDLVLSETAPSIDIKIKCPEGKLRQISAKISNLSDRHLAAQIKLVNQKNNFLFEGTVDANVETIDDFHIKATANSPYLKIEKYVIEAQNKPAKAGRRIQVTAKSGNKNILAGSTSYTAREEQGKLIVEGSGAFKVYEQTKTANFKYIRQNLNQAKDGETGLEVSFDATLGNKAIDAELKVTNKQFRILNSYCEEKKQCAHVELDVKTSADDVDYFHQEIEIAIDLRKLGLSHEFGLKAVTTRKEYVLDHTVDIHFQNQDNSKYQYSLYLHPKEAGVSLTTPKRIISLEADVNCPKDVAKNGGRVSAEIVLYLDKKNQPNQKSGLIAFLDVNVQGQSVVGEARFTNPGLRRPLIVGLQSRKTSTSVDSVLTLDVFAQPDQKIVANCKSQWPDFTNWKRLEFSESFSVKSNGLGVGISYDGYALVDQDKDIYQARQIVTYLGPNSKYDSGYQYEASSKKVHFLLTVLNEKILLIDSNLRSAPNQQIIDSEIKYLRQKPLVSHLEIKNWNTFKYTLAHKDKPNDKLQINSGFIPGQIADFRAEIIRNGASQELGHVTIKLDDANFLKSDYNVQSKNIEELLIKRIKLAIQTEENQLKQISEELVKNCGNELNHVGEVAKRASPNFAPLRQYYVSELTKIKEEVLADKTIRDLSEFLYNIFAAFSQAFGETFSSFSQLVENIALTFQNTIGKVLEAAQRDLLPQVKELTDKFLNLAIEIIDTATNVILTIGVKTAEIAEKYRPEIQQLTAVLGEVSQDVFRAVINVYEAVRNVLLDQWQQVYGEMKNLPVIQQLEHEYNKLVKEGFPPPEAIANGLQDLLSTIKDIAPTQQLKELIQAISDYVTKKLRHQPVDDKSSIDRIVKAAVSSVREIVDLIFRSEAPGDLQNVKVPIPSTLWSRLPKWSSVRFSPLSYILQEAGLPEDDFILSLVNRPRNWVPPFPLYGLIAQGQHIFTFDGKHLTFPGTCNYLLARDAVDGNFTIIGSYDKGLLTAISLVQGSDTITLKKHGQVLLNNAASELPIRKPNIAAYRGLEYIVLRSVYGVTITCGPELLVCGVSTSGFYHGKLRGLLGNGNNEPYDDFALPNGKIVTSESEFGNSYKTTASCGAVQTVSHHEHHSNPSCNKLFGLESSLRYCYPFVSTHNYKMACEHGLAAGVKDTEHAIAVAYVAACNFHGIPIRTPSEFVKCTNGDKPASVGDQFSVKTPAKSADIVVLVDTSKENEPTYKEYVQPLIQQLTNELSSKGVGDIEFHLIVWGGENQWPSHITNNGGKLTFKGKAPNLKFSERPEEESVKTGCPQLDSTIELIISLGADVKLAFGQDLQALTYSEGLRYPFRANSIKSIIAVTSKPCEVGRFYPLQVLRTLLYRDKSINLNLITPIEKAGAKSEAKNIVGFNSQSVFALGQTKNKIKYFPDLGKELVYHDYCVDFTVNNGGNVFVSNHIHQQPKGLRKQFIQITSHGIVDQLVSVERGYDCECQYVSPYTVANVCKLVSSKDKPQGKKGGTKS